MMIPINTKPSEWRYREDFRRIGDLVNFEGPELVVFEQVDTQQIFVFDWVDRDRQQNRWLIFEALAGDLLEFVYTKITHSQLFLRATERPIYVLDIDNQKGFSNLPVLQIDEVPKEYYPKDVSFDKIDCPDLGRITTFLQDRINKESFENHFAKDKTGFKNLWQDIQIYPLNTLDQSGFKQILFAKIQSLSPLTENDYVLIEVSPGNRHQFSNFTTTNIKSYGYPRAC
jgi:hypothetical protein